MAQDFAHLGKGASGHVKSGGNGRWAREVAGAADSSFLASLGCRNDKIIMMCRESGSSLGRWNEKTIYDVSRWDACGRLSAVCVTGFCGVCFRLTR